jgi:hypothetical protein
VQENTRLHRSLGDLHDALFAINTACAIVLLAFANSPLMSAPFGHLEVRINHILHIRQTDYIRGHFQFWIPALGLAFFFWVMLRIFARTQLTNRVLLYLAGAAAFFLLPVVWIYADLPRSWFFVPPYEGPLELAVAIILFLLFLYRNPHLSIWVGLGFAIAHYVFWSWLKGGGLGVPNWDAPGYFGPIGPVLGLSSAIVWLMLWHPLHGVRQQNGCNQRSLNRTTSQGDLT